MSSLVTYSSPWNNDTSSSKKRTPTMRRTLKSRSDVQEGEEYPMFSDNIRNLQPSTIDEVQANSQVRSDRVNELLNKITTSDASNDNNKLGNFTPLDPPSLNVKKDITDGDNSTQYVPPIYTMPNFNKPTSDSANMAMKYAANSGQGDKYSNYSKSYDGSSTVPMSVPYYANMGLGKGAPRDDKLMEKINYMIHLLEQQQNEKTDNVTEEFLLYTFLGVFIIFIVDSFARTGKYTR